MMVSSKGRYFYKKINYQNQFPLGLIMEEFDVIVCGAGPSGSTAAKYLAENGLNVLLLDKSTFPRDKACGGGLCEHISEFDHILEKIEEDDPPNEFLESICKRGVIISPSCEMKIDYIGEKPLFYNIRREKFDYELVQFAIDAGAEFMENSEVKEISITSEKAFVKLSKGQEYSCEIIVGASGPYDISAKYLRNKENLPKDWGEDLGLAVVEEFEVGEEFVDKVFGKERASHINLKHAGIKGYAWIFSKGSILNIGYGGFMHEIKKIDTKEEFNNYLKYLKKAGYLPENIKSKNLKGAPLPFGGPIDKTYMDRLIIVGDAAGFVSPLTGEGIHYAVDSGKIAAETINKAFEKGDFTAQTLKEYQDIWMKKWGKDLKALKFFQRRIMAWPEAIIKYGSKDKKLKELFVGIFVGSVSASKIKNKLILRIIRDFLLYDIFRMK